MSEGFVSVKAVCPDCANGHEWGHRETYHDCGDGTIDVQVLASEVDRLVAERIDALSENIYHLHRMVQPWEPEGRWSCVPVAGLQTFHLTLSEALLRPVSVVGVEE